MTPPAPMLPAAAAAAPMLDFRARDMNANFRRDAAFCDYLSQLLPTLPFLIQAASPISANVFITIALVA